MNTLQISSILKSFPSSSRAIKGVLARDQFIQQKITYPSLFVCNTDNSDQPGTHWVAIYFSTDQKCEYFDSYGILPLFDDVMHKLLSIDSNFKYNSFTLQSLDTNVCGMYCIIYTVMRTKGYTLKSIIQMLLLPKTSYERDSILEYFLKSYLSEFCYGQLSPVKLHKEQLVSQSCLCKSAAL